ncbi:hypothetical protein RIR_jg22109.t1 [Rhizophagus irregularis DAOM 181602=DAOM 197198]|nr:hypothetical protein RIR_jg22109.t1 [Rhizophagus irregularis DAOM 181602=DAOM 197198]CAB4488662.1 unnamed protein product [Rhizophagus irregularis]
MIAEMGTSTACTVAASGGSSGVSGGGTACAVAASGGSKVMVLRGDVMSQSQQHYQSGFGEQISDPFRILN